MSTSLLIFLTIAVVCLTLFLCFLINMAYKQNAKKYELESLKTQQADSQNEVEAELKKNVTDLTKRIEVLETIVTDKQFNLKDEINELE